MELLKSAFRALRAHAFFSSLIIALLALGIGANTAIFGVVHAVLLQPLPYPEPGELVLARRQLRDGPVTQLASGGDLMPDNELLAWLEAEPKSFRALAGYRNTAATLQLGEGAVRVPSASVTGGFFPLLGVSAWRGRLFSADDLKPGAAPTTVLSYSAWLSRFNGADDALGRIVKLDEVAHTIIGVLPPSFEFTDPVQFWRPLVLVPNTPGQMRIQLIRVFGRLFPGASREAAQRELDRISENFWGNQSFAGGPPGLARGPGVRPPFADASTQLVPLQEQLARQSRTTLWLLLGAVSFVLLIACANIANLQLARAAARRRDAAVRAALGASPRRLAAELLAENLLLALAGGALGVLLAWWGTQALHAWLADTLPRVNPIGLNAIVLGFAVLLALAAGIGFGLAPAWQGSRVDLLETLKDGGHQSSPGGARWRQALVAFEIALALVLAINTGLLVKAIYELNTRELGYRTSDVLTADLALPRRYATAAQQREFAARWLEALRVVPGVKLSALADIPPLSAYASVVFAAGAPARENTRASAAPATMSVVSVTPDFFRVTGIALREGRLFTEADAADAPAVALVNEEFVHQYFPRGPVLGRTLNIPGGPPTHGNIPTAAIVGVVANVRARGFESAPQPMAYFPLAQQPRGRLAAVLQFEGDAATLARVVTAATHKIDAGLALDQPQTLAQQLERQLAPRRVTLFLTGAFALTAVLLAALGIFGVMSYTVTQRTQEIGVRMALGADATMILRWLLRYAGVAIGVGLIAGVALSAVTNRLLRSLLNGIAALDPFVLAIGVVILAGVGLAACLLPAVRATRIDPVDALRNE
jgi:predicted permease